MLTVPVCRTMNVYHVGHRMLRILSKSDSEDSTFPYTVVSSPFGDQDKALLLPEFVPEPVYPEFMPQEDEVFPTEEQPLHAAVSPTVDSPGYIADSDPEEDKEDPEEDPADYPADGGNDDNDDDDVEEDMYEKEEEHPASADSVPPPVHHQSARLLDIPSPPPPPLSPWSSPLPQIPSPPLPVSSPVPVSPSPLPASPTYLLRYRAAMIQQMAESPSTSHSLPLPPPIILSHIREYVAMMRATTPSTYILAPRSETPPTETPPLGTPPLLSIPLPTLSPPIILPSIVCDIPRYVGYGITDTWDDMVEDMQGTPAETDDDRLLMSGLLNMLYRDRRAHARTTLLIKREDRLSREVWVWSTDASDKTPPIVLSRAQRTTVIKWHQKEPPEPTPAATTATTFVMNAQLKEMIDQGVTDALATRDANITQMAMTSIIQERVLEGQNELLENALTQTS
ncbi:hypothetical protein Tco_0184140 [Tanacetum coccineum]